mgnify:CR=1 FL=1
MSVLEISQKLMQAMHVGLVIIKVDDMKPIFSNQYFRKWFQAESDGSLGLLLELVNLEEYISDLQPDMTKDLETTLKVGRRELSLTAHFSILSSETETLVLVEVHNNTRIKEMEAMIQSYAKMVERNERDLTREKDRAEKLLLNIMPKSVLQELKEFGVTAPRLFDKASVLMLDFIDFTEMSIADDPASIVSELNDIFTNFDQIVEQFGCERIKTIGDAYMAVSGLPEPNPDHAHNIAKAALLFKRYLEQRNKINQSAWNARIGIATGPVIGSIVGIHKYVYDIFGPAVNLAARMERRSEPMQITLCSPMADLLEPDFNLTKVGEEDIKGFGHLTLHRLNS